MPPPLQPAISFTLCRILIQLRPSRHYLTSTKKDCKTWRKFSNKSPHTPGLLRGCVSPTTNQIYPPLPDLRGCRQAAQRLPTQAPRATAAKSDEKLRATTSNQLYSRQNQCSLSTDLRHLRIILQRQSLHHCNCPLAQSTRLLDADQKLQRRQHQNRVRQHAALDRIATTRAPNSPIASNRKLVMFSRNRYHQFFPSQCPTPLLIPIQAHHMNIAN